jgi:6-phosphofructokinase 1
LIQGEDYPPYDKASGLPQYVRLKKVPVKKKLKTDFQI